MMINYLLIAMKSIISQKVNNNLVGVGRRQSITWVLFLKYCPNTYLVILKQGLSLGAGG